jgi:hypothetical protein
MTIEDFSFQAMSNVIQFVYTRTIDDLTEEKAVEIQKCARFFSLDILVATMQLYTSKKQCRCLFVFAYKFSVL